MSELARAQVAHGDLTAFNVLVHDGQLVLIDLPQIVDVIANPHGCDFIAATYATWRAGSALAAYRRT
jgi:RIO kinase 1